MGFIGVGQDNPNAKLKEWQVKEILDLLQDCDLGYGDIASRYGVNVSTIRRINEGNTWSGVSRDGYSKCEVRTNKARGSGNGHARLNEQQAREIIERLKDGESAVSLAHEYHVSPSHIGGIKNGKKWSHLQ